MQTTDLILTTDNLSDEQIAMLTTEVARHPYFHAAALSLTSALYNRSDIKFGETLQHTAISIPDRNTLFTLIEGAEYTLDSATAPQRRKRQRAVAADSTTDYMAYLMQQEGASQAEDSGVEMHGQSLIDNFIDNNAEGERIKLQGAATAQSDTPEPKPTASSKKTAKETPIQAASTAGRQASQEVISVDDDEELLPEYFTESMARIYIKQGKFDKAIKIISRLNDKYPKKNRYFADQMRFLEKLMLNQRYNKD